ncbi:MAG: protein-glutamate O-methyltransferase CheR [Nitrospirae bacterium]|nr:protein-glutamate O-methyltransferase CheR [Nitrospirota bacterium]
MQAAGQKLTDAEFNALRDYIYNKSGIFFTERNRFQLETKIKERLDKTGCRDAFEYVKHLEDYKAGAAELDELFNTVTVNETSFFRDKSFISALEKNVIPELVQKYDMPGFKQIRVWSAASSSGEEAYTIAILLSECLKDAISRWRIRIHATDIDDNVLKRCKDGKYKSSALRNVSPSLIEKYFDRSDADTFSVKNNLKEMVVPAKCNLINPASCSAFSGVDLILIRNVLIYFDAESKKKVLKMCYENLRNGGYMFLGHSETIFGVTTGFKMVSFVNATAYRK